MHTSIPLTYDRMPTYLAGSEGRLAHPYGGRTVVHGRLGGRVLTLVIPALKPRYADVRVHPERNLLLAGYGDQVNVEP